MLQTYPFQIWPNGQKAKEQEKEEGEEKKK